MPRVSDARSSSANSWRPIIDLTAVGGASATIIAWGLFDRLSEFAPWVAVGLVLAIYVMIVRQRLRGAFLVIVPPLGYVIFGLASIVVEILFHSRLMGTVHDSSIYGAGAVTAVFVAGCTIVAAVKHPTGLLRYLALSAVCGALLTIAGLELSYALEPHRIFPRGNELPALRPLAALWLAGMGPLLGWGVSTLGS